MKELWQVNKFYWRIQSMECAETPTHPLTHSLITESALGYLSVPGGARSLFTNVINYSDVLSPLHSVYETNT